MNTLRWVLMVATAATLIGFIVLLTVADGFRRSFGASEHGPLFAALPILMGLVLLCALIFTEPQVLRHVAAAAAVILAGLSIWVFRETAFIGSLGLIYSGLWALWYWQAVWQAGNGQ